jgi:hypothetical protein
VGAAAVEVEETAEAETEEAEEAEEEYVDEPERASGAAAGSSWETTNVAIVSSAFGSSSARCA